LGQVQDARSAFSEINQDPGKSGFFSCFCLAATGSFGKFCKIGLIIPFFALRSFRSGGLTIWTIPLNDFLAYHLNALVFSKLREVELSKSRRRDG
jgi:hypothetical protein